MILSFNYLAGNMLRAIIVDFIYEVNKFYMLITVVRMKQSCKELKLAKTTRTVNKK